MRDMRGCYDIHVHCAPDVVPRSEDLVDLAAAAVAAGLAGILIKDHCTSTVGRVHALNRLYPDGPRFASALALNPPVGGLNPCAVEAALRAGAAMVYFPTYGARCHVERYGIGTAPGKLPLPPDFVGETLHDAAGRLRPEVDPILDLLHEHDAVLATGHLAPDECLALLERARQRGVTRMVVTHASERVPGMGVEDQRRAVALGAMIEHCFLPVTCCGPAGVPLEEIAHQIDAIGAEHVVLSSDFGQVANGPVVPAFADHVERLAGLGMGEADLDRMLRINPRRLVPWSRAEAEVAR